MQQQHISHKKLLKKDLFGEVWLVTATGRHWILRDTRNGRWWLRWVARSLLRREVRALAALDGIRGVPNLLDFDRHSLRRSFVPGEPMYRAQPNDADYFRAARRLLRRIHRAGIVHNDLAKEPNLLVTPDGLPALIDFQHRHRQNAQKVWHGQRCSILIVRAQGIARSGRLQPRR